MENDIEVLLRRALHQLDETLSQQMEAVCQSGGCFSYHILKAQRGRADATKSMQEAQQEDGCRKKAAHAQPTKQPQSVALDARHNVVASALITDKRYVME